MRAPRSNGEHVTRTPGEQRWLAIGVTEHDLTFPDLGAVDTLRQVGAREGLFSAHEYVLPGSSSGAATFAPWQ
jgi:hypothetical protein